MGAGLALKSVCTSGASGGPGLMGRAGRGGGRPAHSARPREAALKLVMSFASQIGCALCSPDTGASGRTGACEGRARASRRSKRATDDPGMTDRVPGVCGGTCTPQGARGTRGRAGPSPESPAVAEEATGAEGRTWAPGRPQGWAGCRRHVREGLRGSMIHAGLRLPYNA